MRRTSPSSRHLSIRLSCSAALLAALGAGAAQAQVAPAPAASASDAEATLPAVRVTPGASPAGPYGAAEAPGNRLGQSVDETPRAISVITRELIDDQAPAAEADLMRNVSGINRYNNYGGSYTGFVLRGLWANNGGSYLRNGTRWLHLMEPMMFNLERIEVIKGPNAIDYGQSAPGGFINYVTKQPLAETRREAKLGVGSDRTRLAEIDLTGALDGERRLLYRLTGGYERGGDFSDHVDPRRHGVALALAWKATAGTQIKLSAEGNRIKLPTNPGMPVPDAADLRSADALRVRSFYGEPRAVFEGKGDFYAVELQQSLAAQWQLRAVLARNEFLRVNPSMWLTGLSDDGLTVGRQVYWSSSQAQDDTTAQLELRGELQTGPFRHQLLLGFDATRTNGRWRSYQIVDLPPVSVLDPQPSGEPLPPWTGETAPDRSRGRGFFVQDAIELGRGWGVQLGLRRDRIEDRVTGETSSRTSPSAALRYRPADGQMLYLSYASSFEPNWGVQLAGGGEPPPSLGKQFELGAKQRWLDGRLFTSAALFELRKTNIPVGIANTDFSRLSGEVRVRGLELEASGAPLPGLDVAAQFSHLDPEVLEDADPSLVGKQPLRTARTTWSLWAKYRLPGALSPWSIGGGAFHTGRTMVDDANTVKLPAYTVFDAVLGWEPTDDLRLSLAVRNLTDRRYYVDAEGAAGLYTAAYPGRPRSVLLTTQLRF